MNSVIGVLGYGLAGLIFFLAGIYTLKPIRMVEDKRPWIASIVASFILTLVAGYSAYLRYLATNPFEFYELFPMILMMVGAGMALTAVLLLTESITREKTEKQSVRFELERFRVAFEKVPFMVIIKDHQGNYLFTNSVYQYFLGKKGQTLVGESDFKFLPRAQALAFRQEEERILETGIPAMRDEEIHGADGVHWVRFSRVLLDEATETGKMLLVTGQDISHLKLIESQSHQLEFSIDQFVDGLADFHLVAEKNSQFENIVKWFGKVANTAHVGIWSMVPDHSIAVLKYGAGKLGKLMGVQLRLGSDLPWKVWQTGQPVVVEKYQNWPDRVSWIQDSDFSTAIGFPLKVHNQPTYVLTIFYEKTASLIRSEQVKLLNILAYIATNHLQFLERGEGYEAENEEWEQKLGKIQNKNRIEHILAVIATYFINLDPHKIGEAIGHALETIAKIIGADRGYLVLFPDQSNGGRATSYSSQKSVNLDELEDTSRIEFQSILQKLTQMETIYYPQVSALNPERDEPAGYLQARGIKSYTAIPLVSNRSLVGYLGYEALKNEVDWSQDILSLLKLNGEMFVNLIDRRNNGMAAREEQEKARMQLLEMEIRSQENSLINEMGDLLQACRTADEAYPIIIRYMQKLLPICSGALYIIHNTKEPAENVAAWGKNPPGPAEHELALNECWALRRGRVYSIADPKSEPVCSHIKESLPSGYICVPLIAQGELVGVLHLRLPKESGNAGFSLDQQQLAVKTGEYIAIPLTNLKLRDELRSQAIRDPLTKLFNRRYMEETLEREIRRANRHATSVGIIMFDIDKMKPINDRYGHDAGDYVLKSLGHEMLRLFRGEDVPCRYGGDEFTIVLPEAPLADVWRRAEQLRDSIKKLNLIYDGKPIGPITLSIGVAAYPDHGVSTERVIMASDAASYASKSEGGNRIMMGHKTET